MENVIFNYLDLPGFERWLRNRDLAENTVRKYLADVAEFFVWLDGHFTSGSHSSHVCDSNDSNHGDGSNNLNDYKRYLVGRNLTPGSVNTKLCSLNSFFMFLGYGELRYKLLRMQKRVFRDGSRELTVGDYRKLLRAAGAGSRTGLLLRVLAGTGIRVSELKYVTVEAVRAGMACVNLKGRYRTIFVPNTLRKEILAYCRKQVWAELKSLAGKAGVLLSKVFPHNFRHLFAVLYYKTSKHDIAKLSDVLGHGSVDTTRIYLASTGAEHLRFLNKLGLIFELICAIILLQYFVEEFRV